MSEAIFSGAPLIADRRIAAIVMPRLFVEIVELLQTRERDVPLAILFDVPTDAPRSAGIPRTPTASSAPIAAINEAAAARGVRVGQTTTEASAFAARLSVVHLDEGRVLTTLHAIADVAFSFGPTVEVDYASLDTIWVDVSGGAHLFDGEEALRIEMEERFRSLGFTANAAIADGPRIAQALARNAGVSVSISKRGTGALSMAPLPIKALFSMPSAPSELHSLFVRLGVFTVEDFVKLPFSEISSRAGAAAKEILALAMGHDPRPLAPYRAADLLFDEVSFEDGVEQSEPLLFTLRGMTSRLAARLQGRGQATNHIEILLRYDRSIHRLRHGATMESDVEIAPVLREIIDLPAPLSNEGDLFRTIKAKIAEKTLEAPVVSFSLTLTRIVGAPRVQLDLSRDISVSPDALPALVSELCADIGEDNVGVLTVVDSHRPEARSQLVSFLSVPETSPSKRTKGPMPELSGANASEPTRLFSTPVAIGALEAGATLFVGRDAFEIEEISFDRRLDGVEWWSPSPLFRDYVNVSLVRSLPALSSSFASRATLRTRAWAYVDRKTGETYLQGLWE